ncbi:type II toxin-antitoxin system HicB family antitoxin [Thermus sediminis]|uniref:type II toxin-antitoxin system HicB family antitoxin n=1 Tax=Thermus sediminis TaxID=1761908 RepID=UPI000E3C1191|nr:type II toxin-antitoxin system HicB family antitoxin [Thermus sediminis]
MPKYTVLIYPDPETPGVWVAEFPAVPQAHSFGQSPEEALARAKEALELVLAFLKAEGKPLPQDVKTAEVSVDAA